eukprot:gene5978-11340_t
MDLNQLMYWDRITGLNYLADSYYYDSDSDTEGVPVAVSAEIVKSNKANADSKLCKFYQRGHCKFGSQCRFLHAYGEDRQQPMDTCSFFLKGNCRYGANCHFMHPGYKEIHQIQVDKRTPSKKVSSVFSPSDEDLKAGRLTRIKLYFDHPVKDSVKLEGHQIVGCQYFLDVFVDKRGDDVQYLHDVVENRAQHPLYRKGMFGLSKAGTNLDLSELSQKLSDTSVFIFGSSVDVLLTQSYSLAATVVDNKELAVKRRYPMSALAREVNGSFQEKALRSLLKVYPKPDIGKGDSNANHISPSTAEDKEPAKLYKMTSDVGKRVKQHCESECCWCVKKGCGCLVRLNEDIESDNSELSCNSRDARNRRSIGGNFECGFFPESLEPEDVAAGIQFKLGDIVTFGEYPSVTLYVVSENGSLKKLKKDGFLSIPFQVSSCFQDPVKKYEGICKYYSSGIGDLMGIYIKPDDVCFVRTFGDKLPLDWKCCFVAKCGSKDLVDHFRIEVDEKNVFTALPPDVQGTEEISPVNCIEEIYQRGQSLKESASFTRFDVELSLKESERALLLKKHGAVYPKIPTWSGRLSRVQGGKGQLNVSVTWQGPSVDENVAKAIIEEFYEGCTWRYGRIRDASC